MLNLNKIEHTSFFALFIVFVIVTCTIGSGLLCSWLFEAVWNSLS